MYPLPPRPAVPLRSGEIDYFDLVKSAASGNIVFRVWSADSVSPLELVEDDMSRSGFSAPCESYRHMSPVAYSSATHGIDRVDWASGAVMRGNLARHILGYWPREEDREEASKFISATRNLDWAIWEVTRRLAQAKNNAGVCTVHIAVIQVGGGSSAHAHWLSPGSIITSLLRSGSVPDREKAGMLCARTAADQCDEVLFLGRIFGANVLADLAFTSETLPFYLPARFFRPLSYAGNDCRGWLKRVRWDPATSAWKGAENLIRSGSYAFPTSWKTQPVHFIPTSWPNAVTVRSTVSVASDQGQSAQRLATFRPHQSRPRPPMGRYPVNVARFAPSQRYVQPRYSPRYPYFGERHDPRHDLLGPEGFDMAMARNEAMLINLQL